MVCLCCQEKTADTNHRRYIDIYANNEIVVGSHLFCSDACEACYNRKQQSLAKKPLTDSQSDDKVIL